MGFTVVKFYDVHTVYSRVLVQQNKYLRWPIDHGLSPLPRFSLFVWSPLNKMLKNKLNFVQNICMFFNFRKINKEISCWLVSAPSAVEEGRKEIWVMEWRGSLGIFTENPVRRSAHLYPSALTGLQFPEPSKNYISSSSEGSNRFNCLISRFSTKLHIIE